MSAEAKQPDNDSKPPKDSSSSSSGVHILPVSISYDGPAAVSTYFLTKELANGELEAHFRGRRLVGRRIAMTEDVMALHVVTKPSDDGKNSSVEVVREVSSVDLWQHGMPPSLQLVEECMDWIEIANELHAI